MKAKPAACFAALLGLLAVAIPVMAHHGGVAYETGKRITLKGTISNFEWTNPHSQVHLDVTDDNGGVRGGTGCLGEHNPGEGQR